MTKGIGNYIHYHTKNYEAFGTTQNGPSDYSQGTSILNAKIKRLREQAWSLHKQYTSSEIEELERFMNSIFYPQKGAGRSDIEQKQFEQAKAYVEKEFEKKYNGFVINWEQGLSVYSKGTKSIGQKTQINTLNKVYKQLQSALERVSNAKTKQKIQEAQTSIENALKELQSSNIDTTSAVTIGKHLTNSNDLIEKVNAALRATMYNNAAIGYVFELALAAFSGQVSTEVRDISVDMVNEALQATTRSNPRIRIDLMDKNFFDEDLFEHGINKNQDSSIGVWQKTLDGTGFQFSAPTQNKLDVALSFNDQEYQMSAKNYANINQRDIHIVSGTSFLIMIVDDGVDFINHYLNIIGTNPGVRGNNLTLAHEAMKLNILLKALTGLESGKEQGFADILVVNDRKNKHIYIKSIGYLVTKISYRLDSIDKYLKINGLNKDGTLSFKNDYVGNKDYPNEDSAKERITKLLIQLQATKIRASIKGNTVTDLAKSKI